MIFVKNARPADIVSYALSPMTGTGDQLRLAAYAL
jgi:hypothetical protein